MIYSDLTIRNCLTKGLEDLRLNAWLIQDMMGVLVNNPTNQPPSNFYGDKEVNQAIEFFQNNKIDVLMKYRLDKDTFPCVTVALGSSQESLEEKTLSDLHTYSVPLAPSTINQTLGYIIPPFTPISYDEPNGILTVDPSINLNLVNMNQILVDPKTGSGWLITGIGVNQIFIAPNSKISGAQLAVVPQFQTFQARIGRIWFKESFNIGVHCTEPATLLWLSSAVAYILLRYRESLLEAQGFFNSAISMSDFAPNSSFAMPNGVYSRYFTLNGMCEQSWVEQPSRLVESTIFGVVNSPEAE